MFSSIFFHQQSSVPVQSSLAKHAQRQKYLPDPNEHRWPLSLACHDSTSITGGFVMDGQLLKVAGCDGRHRGNPDDRIVCCCGKPYRLEHGCLNSRLCEVREPGNSRRAGAWFTEVCVSGKAHLGMPYFNIALLSQMCHHQHLKCLSLCVVIIER